MDANIPLVERYVPRGKHSLVSDAPGWSASHNTNEAAGGPVCWKCKGRGELVEKKMSRMEGTSVDEQKMGKKRKRNVLTGTKNNSTMKPCQVCQGIGSIPPKKKEMASLESLPGMITSKRRCPDGTWQTMGPKAHAVVVMEKMLHREGGGLATIGEIEIQENNSQQHPLLFLHRANSMESGEAGVTVPPVEYAEYPWFPFNRGEQLCNLVGDWRILQRVGSHRWTTDDIVTAFIAIQEMTKSKTSDPTSTPLTYLDLGCGNGSVLQMTSWGLLDKYNLQAFGIEARLEAASLARRSLSFNVGQGHESPIISVIHGDFRDIVDSQCPLEHSNRNNNQDQLQKFYRAKEQKFDLVTGTPPYFQVDFKTQHTAQHSSDNSPEKVVTSAVICQGGMPTSIQSAPARCEFRGGIEDYCKAAATVLKKDGIFVVCENWLNHKRVYSGAKAAGLKVKIVHPVKGKRDRKENLFGVYVLQREDNHSSDDDLSIEGHIVEPLAVRSECGKWTMEYAELLEAMSIPAKHNAV